MNNSHPWDKKYNLVFWIMVVIGVSLCIGGVWVAPLLVPGGVALTGAAAMYASAYTRMYPWRQDDSPTHGNPAPAARPDVEASHPTNINIDHINILNQYETHHSHSGTSKQEGKKEIQKAHSEPLPTKLDI